MKNRVFQFLWIYVVQKFIRVDDKQTGIDRVYNRMVWQLRFAKLFGGAAGVILGDSNGAALAFFRSMRRFTRVTVNIAVPGTEAHDWIKFFATDRGKLILSMLTGIIIWNIGGNYSLKSEIDMAEYGLTELHAMFPDSYNCDIPPIYFDILDKIDDNLPTDKTQQEWESEIQTVNQYIHAAWGIKTIPMHTLFTNPVNGGVIPGALKDMVHYSIISAIFICGALTHIYGNIDKLLTYIDRIKP